MSTLHTSKKGDFGSPQNTPTGKKSLRAQLAEYRLRPRSNADSDEEAAMAAFEHEQFQTVEDQPIGWAADCV